MSAAFGKTELSRSFSRFGPLLILEKSMKDRSVF